jgi:hypothetical protein
VHRRLASNVTPVNIQIYTIQTSLNNHDNTSSSYYKVMFVNYPIMDAQHFQCRPWTTTPTVPNRYPHDHESRAARPSGSTQRGPHLPDHDRAGARVQLRPGPAYPPLLSSMQDLHARVLILPSGRPFTVCRAIRLAPSGTCCPPGLYSMPGIPWNILDVGNGSSALHRRTNLSAGYFGMVNSV